MKRRTRGRRRMTVRRGGRKYKTKKLKVSSGRSPGRIGFRLS